MGLTCSILSLLIIALSFRNFRGIARRLGPLHSTPGGIDCRIGSIRRFVGLRHIPCGFGSFGSILRCIGHLDNVIARIECLLGIAD
jgi:hypothetical protein